jgi:hypothetical protein
MALLMNSIVKRSGLYALIRLNLRTFAPLKPRFGSRNPEQESKAPCEKLEWSDIAVFTSRMKVL